MPGTSPWRERGIWMVAYVWLALLSLIAYRPFHATPIIEEGQAISYATEQGDELRDTFFAGDTVWARRMLCFDAREGRTDVEVHRTLIDSSVLILTPNVTAMEPGCKFYTFYLNLPRTLPPGVWRLRPTLRVIQGRYYGFTRQLGDMRFTVVARPAP